MKTEARNSRLLRKENNAIIQSCYVSSKDAHDKGTFSNFFENFDSGFTIIVLNSPNFQDGLRKRSSSMHTFLKSSKSK